MAKRGRRPEECKNIICGGNCATCGFNKQEQARRLNDGEWHTVFWRANMETGELIKIQNGARRLVFKKGEANA